MTRTIEDLHADRTRTFIAPIVPLAIVGVCIAFAIAALTSWLRDRPNLDMIVLISAVWIVVMLAMAYLIRRYALQGRIDATGLVGIAFVTFEAIGLSLIPCYNGNGVMQAMPFCAILAVTSVIFWVRSWQFSLALTGMLLPPLVLLMRTENDRDIKAIALQLAIYTAIICVALHLLIRRANLKTFALALEVEYRATHDGLTGLSNRTHWIDLATRSLESLETARGDCTLFFIDVDGFKQFNDRSGHAAGDHYLVQLATVLRATIDDAALIGRFGGDEFVALLPGAGSADANIIADQIHQALSSVDHDMAGLSASIGIAQWRPGETLDQLLRRADVAMFAAKASGVKAVSM